MTSNVVSFKEALLRKRGLDHAVRTVLPNRFVKQALAAARKDQSVAEHFKKKEK